MDNDDLRNAKVFGWNVLVFKFEQTLLPQTLSNSWGNKKRVNNIINKRTKKNRADLLQLLDQNMKKYKSTVGLCYY